MYLILQVYVLWINFHMPCQYLYKSCIYCWVNKHLSNRARKHTILLDRHVLIVIGPSFEKPSIPANTWHKKI